VFDFSDEQQQVRDSLRRLLAADYPFGRRREIAAGPGGWSADIWRALADLGVLALTLPQEHGGLGGGMMDAYVVMEEGGRALLLEPFLPTVVMGAGLVARAGSAQQRADVLPAVGTGERQLAFAHYEPGHRYALDAVACEARCEGGGWLISGTKAHVLNGASADQLIVSARTTRGLSLYLIRRDAPGVTVRDHAMYDARHAADLHLEDVRVDAADLLGDEGGAAPEIAATLDDAITALCADAVGVMDALLAATGQYLKTRKQFGVPIGSFQVLQHRMADMLLEAEAARSMALLAARSASQAAPGERSRIVSAAKLRVGEAARFVGQQAVQLHGGIGVTDELAISHYFRRLVMFEMAFGDADHHLDAFGRHLFD
jgi:alkylation response protein AidB-like acyl-CoA dehydrogenase